MTEDKAGLTVEGVRLCKLTENNTSAHKQSPCKGNWFTFCWVIEVGQAEYLTLLYALCMLVGRQLTLFIRSLAGNLTWKRAWEVGTNLFWWLDHGLSCLPSGRMGGTNLTEEKEADWQKEAIMKESMQSLPGLQCLVSSFIHNLETLLCFCPWLPWNACGSWKYPAYIMFLIKVALVCVY